MRRDDRVVLRLSVWGTRVEFVVFWRDRRDPAMVLPPARLVPWLRGHNA